jgi:DNA-binding CsgD family transcriptional regulator/tetratricopeptide (TPR) repeat protein
VTGTGTAVTGPGSSGTAVTAPDTGSGTAVTGPVAGTPAPGAHSGTAVTGPVTGTPAGGPDNHAAPSYHRGMLVSVTAHATSAALVGRDADLAALCDAFGRARAGEPTAVLVGGEAGVGKTRLVEEFCRYVSGEGAQVLTGQCLELGEEGLPFAPFAAALRDLLRRDGPAAFAGQQQEFARLLPELGPAGPEAVTEARRGYLFELVGALFARLAAERPLMLVVEDLHWADRSTRDLIGFLVRAARTARVLLVCTYRSDELHRGHPLRPFLAELDRVRGVQRLELDRLDRDDTAEVLTHLLGCEPAPATIDNIHVRAQGNPFFIEELAVTADPANCCDIPDSLRDLLLSRVDQLPEPAQRVLRIAAVGGTRFGHQLLTRVAGLPDAELEAALRVAVAAQLVVVDAEGGYEFRHALVREAVHDDLLPGEHARLHAGYAAAIEADPSLVACGRAPAEIAHHWHAAHDHPRALVAAHRAAAAAGQRYAYAEQFGLLERVLDLWEQVPDAADRLGMGHVDLLEETTLAAIAAGDHMRALSLTRVALADLDDGADPARAARLLVRRGKLLRNAGKSDGGAEMRRAYELLHASTDPGRVVLMADIAYVLGSLDAEEAGRIAKEALAAAEEMGDAAGKIAATITFGRVCSRVVSPEEGLVEMRRAAERARAAGDLPQLTQALVNISDTLCELGRYTESAQAASDGLPDADRVGVSRTTGVYLLANHAEALVALGRWDEADARCAEAARLDPPGTLALPWLTVRARLRLARSHPGAGQLVTRALGFLGKPYLKPDDRLPLLELRVLAALAAGDGPAAVSAATAALADPVLPGPPRYAWPLLATAARATTEVPDTADLRGQIAAVAAGLPARYPAEKAYAAQVRAVLTGDGQDVTAWRAAVDAWRADGQVYPLACALLSFAAVAAAHGDRAAAAEAVAETAAIAARLGVTPLADDVTTLARRLGLRAPGHPAPGTEVLTAREREVLRLVAEGHSNSRIAERLYISPKTASVHVSRIIAKLSVSNRVEAAAVAHRLGLLDGTR